MSTAETKEPNSKCPCPKCGAVPIQVPDDLTARVGSDCVIITHVGNVTWRGSGVEMALVPDQDRPFAVRADLALTRPDGSKLTAQASVSSFEPFAARFTAGDVVVSVEEV